MKYIGSVTAHRKNCNCTLWQKKPFNDHVKSECLDLTRLESVQISRFLASSGQPILCLFTDFVLAWHGGSLLHVSKLWLNWFGSVFVDG